MPRHYQEMISKVTARCHLLLLLHWMLSDGCQEMASIREDTQRLPPKPTTSAYLSKRNICPQPWPLMEIPEVMAEWKYNPQRRQGWPLCQEPLPPKRGLPLPSTPSSARSWWLGQGLPLSWTSGTLFKAGLGSRSFQALTFPLMRSGPWLGLY